MQMHFALGLGSALRGIHENWTDTYGQFAHGYLILAMALWLAWQRREPLRTCPIRPWWPGAVLLAGSVFGLVLADVLAIDSAMQSLVPIVLLCVIALAFGLGIARILLPAVVMLYFALPAWWLLDYPLQWLTAAVANVVVGITGIPAHVEGNVFHLPIGQVEIASGCNGLNYLMVGMALAYFQGMMFLRTAAARVRLLAVAVLLALLSNWLRVCALIWIAYATDMQHYLIRVDHLYFGWGLFLLVVWPMFHYAARLERREHAMEAAVVGLPRESSARGRQAAWAAGVAALIVLAPLLLQKFLLSGAVAAAEGWDRVQVEGRGIDLYRAIAPVYGGPDIPNRATDVLGRRWRGGPEAVHESAAGFAYLEQVGVLDGSEHVMRSGKVVAGKSVLTTMQAKVATLQGLVNGRSDEQLWLALAPCKGDCEAARTALDQLPSPVR
jgi:exosortase